ncbi:hypothetical protein ACFBZI_05005 [Moraxella sp. ZJ142]|uniref:hypothetical protein n=1 Tax=Moraxella marmotae TaxID=3344520 RepID=UPI0035D4FFBA
MQTITLHLDNADYEYLINYAGQKNVESFILDTLKPHIDFIKNINHQTQAAEPQGAFDEFFGILQSDKNISLDDMSNAIKMRGGSL